MILGRNVSLSRCVYCSVQECVILSRHVQLPRNKYRNVCDCLSLGMSDSRKECVTVWMYALFCIGMCVILCRYVWECDHQEMCVILHRNVWDCLKHA